VASYLPRWPACSRRGSRPASVRHAAASRLAAAWGPCPTASCSFSAPPHASPPPTRPPRALARAAGLEPVRERGEAGPEHCSSCGGPSPSRPARRGARDGKLAGVDQLAEASTMRGRTGCPGSAELGQRFRDVHARAVRPVRGHRFEGAATKMIRASKRDLRPQELVGIPLPSIRSCGAGSSATPRPVPRGPDRGATWGCRWICVPLMRSSLPAWQDLGRDVILPMSCSSAARRSP